LLVLVSVFHIIHLHFLFIFSLVVSIMHKKVSCHINWAIITNNRAPWEDTPSVRPSEDLQSINVWPRSYNEETIRHMQILANSTKQLARIFKYVSYEIKKIFRWTGPVLELRRQDRDAWVAQTVKCLTLDLSSGLDLRVLSSSPALGSMLGMEST